MKRQSGLIVYGPVEGPTGYDTVCREVLRGLFTLGVDVTLKPFPKWSTQRVLIDDNSLQMIEHCIKHQALVGTPTLNICLPEQVPLEYGSVLFNYTMFEGSCIPENWAECSRHIDITIVPGESSRQAFLAGGVPEYRIHVVPLGVNPQIFNASVPPLPLHDKRGRELVEHYAVRVLITGEDTTRKNTRQAIKVTMKALQGHTESCIIVRSANYSRHSDLPQYIAALREENPDYPDVFLFDQMLPPNLMGNFFALATHYFSLSHAEGWDLNCMQCLAMQRQVVVPYHTGYTDYLDQFDPSMVTLMKDVVPIKAYGMGTLNRIYNNSNWFEIPEESAIAALQEAILKRAAPQGTQGFVEYPYSWFQTAQRLMEVVQQYV